MDHFHKRHLKSNNEYEGEEHGVNVLRTVIVVNASNSLNKLKKKFE